jgi:hypothetical protein
MPLPGCEEDRRSGDFTDRRSNRLSGIKIFVDFERESKG